jgi:hypothetical protein
MKNNKKHETKHEKTRNKLQHFSLQARENTRMIQHIGTLQRQKTKHAPFSLLYFRRPINLNSPHFTKSARIKNL